MLEISNQWVVVSGDGYIADKEPRSGKLDYANSYLNFDNISLKHLESITQIKTTNMFWDIDALLDSSVTLPADFISGLQTQPKNSNTLIDYYVDWLLKEPSFNKLQVKCNLPLAFHSKSNSISCQVQGVIDRVISSRISVLDIPILIVTANKNDPIKSFSKLLSMAAVLHKERKNKQIYSNMYGVYADGERWRFIMVDENSNIWKSKTFTGFIDELVKDDLERIYQLLYFILKAAK
ncbi:hypothetical protein HK103_006550 [Boothiomyces macroporosus]|uniref:Uncharacterized protein n=1 Tax=Boothiomyces macroporosus TaxID=261099 RepID=A0AAD5UDP5_9FUNG|nr:hypothetical protein HK103_006550 [Boothiomyces macroporosus]